MSNTKTINGVVHVWDVFENGWVTEQYWEYVNGRSDTDPDVRSYADAGRSEEA
jgi:hypothetical protein